MRFEAGEADAAGQGAGVVESVVDAVIGAELVEEGVLQGEVERGEPAEREVRVAAGDGVGGPAGLEEREHTAGAGDPDDAGPADGQKGDGPGGVADEIVAGVGVSEKLADGGVAIIAGENGAVRVGPEEDAGAEECLEKFFPHGCMCTNEVRRLID